MAFEKLKISNCEILIPPPYSPYIELLDYFVVISLSNILCIKKYDSLETLKIALDFIFVFIPMEFYSRGIDKLVNHWEQNLSNDGEYIENKISVFLIFLFNKKL